MGDSGGIELNSAAVRPHLRLMHCVDDNTVGGRILCIYLFTDFLSVAPPTQLKHPGTVKCAHFY